MNTSRSWKQLYESAFLELDPALLPQKINDARRAIAERVLALLENGDAKAEKAAMERAYLALDALQRISQNKRCAG